MAKNKMIKRGEFHPSWVGNNFKSLSGLHDWIRFRKPKPKYCEHCKIKTPIDLSKKNGIKYSRNIKDYEWLCRRCHMIYDGRISLPHNKCKCGKLTKNKVYCSLVCRKKYGSKYKNGLYYCPGCKEFLEKSKFSICKERSVPTYCKKCISKMYYYNTVEVGGSNPPILITL